MEIRVLKYFLMAAREENITRAAQLLHLTQPTLSRQLMQLEDELGVQLFKRSRHRIILTEDGMLLRRRAEEIVDLADKTKDDFLHKREKISGTVSVGSGELRSSRFLAHLISGFQHANPHVIFNIYSGNTDNIKERLERGLLDVGLLQEPVDITKYEFIRTPVREQWGAYLNENSHLADMDSLSPSDLADEPLILPGRENLQNVLMNWFGHYSEGLHVTASGNLLYNLATLAQENRCCVIALNMDVNYPGLRFIPLSPPIESGSATVLVWKKTQAFSSAATVFLDYLKNACGV